MGIAKIVMTIVTVILRKSHYFTRIKRHKKGKEEEKI